MKYSIFSLNICLGVFRKLTELAKWTEILRPDICFIQECEITNDNIHSISLKNYCSYSTPINPKARLCLFLNSKLVNKLNVKTCQKTETILVEDEHCQIVGMYRPFKLIHHSNAMEYISDVNSFLRQNLSVNKEIVIIGNLNLDYAKIADQKYVSRLVFDEWIGLVDSFGLHQLVNTPTWSRIIKDVEKSSILDHCYANSPLDLEVIDPLISDHKALLINKNLTRKKSYSSSIKRKWKNYSKRSLNELLSEVCWERFKFMDLDQMTDFLELELLSALHKIAPETIINSRERNIAWSDSLLSIKRKKNNLLKRGKKTKNQSLIKRAKHLDRVFRETIRDEKRKKIRMNINLSNPNSLWDAIRVAENKFGQDEIPSELFESGVRIVDSNKAQVFADFFKGKVEKLRTMTAEVRKQEAEVFNGNQLLEHDYSSPFEKQKVLKAIKDLNSKNSFGFDRVPMRVLVDSSDVTIDTLVLILKKIESYNEIPYKWKMGRIIPLLKKGSPKDVANYRPISNICSMAKLYEKCIQNELKVIEEKSNISLTGVNQHGFRKGKSTTTLGLQLQDRIASSLERNEMVGLVSIDLSAAFDTISKELLIARLLKIGLNPRIVDLIKAWICDRHSYVECDNLASYPYCEKWGTPQGSILGPTLFAMYMHPLLQICDDVVMYADDNYFITSGVDVDAVKNAMILILEKATKWLSDSELCINYKKTEFVIFSNKETKQVSIKVNGNEIISKDHMNVLGVLFDKNLKWSNQVEKTINNAKQSSYKLKALRPYFSESEMLKILTSMIFSKFYYNSIIWYTPFLNKREKRRILSTSAYLIKTAFNLTDWQLVSHNDIHSICGRATPEMFSNYTTANTLYSIIENEFPVDIFNKLSHSTLSNVRTATLYFPDKSRKKVGLNCFSNRTSYVSKKLPQNWWTLSKSSFKKQSKSIFMSFA